MFASIKIKIAAAAIVVSVLAVLWANNKSLRADIVLLEADLDTAIQATVANEKVIGELRDTNNACVRGREADLLEYRLAQERWEVREGQLERDRAKAEADARKVFTEDASCEELGNFNVNAACPALAEQLRELANGS